MADNKKDKIDASSTRASFNQLKDLQNATSTAIYGPEYNAIEDLKVKDNIKSTLDMVKSKSNSTLGDNPVELLSRLNYNSINNSSTTNITKRYNTDTVNSIFGENGAYGMFSDIFGLEQERAITYKQYRLIYDHIPEMAQALDTYVDNIISPDDFSKKFFNIFYNNNNITDGTEDGTDMDKEVIKNLNKLTKTYKMEARAEEIIRDTLMYGDQFVAILHYGKEFKGMLNEGHTLDESTDIFSRYNSGSVTEAEYKLLKEDYDLGLSKYNSIKDTTKKPYVYDTLLEDADFSSLEKLSDKVDQIINANFIIKNGINTMINRELEADVDGFIKKFSKNGHDLNYDNLNDETARRTPPTKLHNIMDPLHTDGHKLSKGLNDINGSIYKNLDPSRVIKLEVDEVCYGYFYMEEDYNSYGSSSFSSLNTVQPSNSSSNSAIGMGMNKNNINPNGSAVSNNYMSGRRSKLLSDIFVNTIARKINSKFIVDNKEFKNIIYSLLNQNFIYEKQVKMLYFAPDEIVHFYINKNGTYGDSLYRKILFPAKLYLAVLLTTLVTKLTRSADRRVYYVETGLDNDQENVIQSFIRDIKTKEFSMNQLNNINNILNNPGNFHDYFIPTFDGEKGFEIDTLQGMDADLNNDFLETLKRNMVSGIGLPASFLNMTEDLEFMRTLAMQNGKFLRSIIGLQSTFSACFTDLYRLLYTNEYLITNNKFNTTGSTNTDGKKNVDINDIEVNFPSPAALAMSSLGEQINNAETNKQFIVTTIMGDGSSGGMGEQDPIDEAVRAEFTKEVTKKLVPGIDWNEYEVLLERIRNKKMGELLDKNAVADMKAKAAQANGEEGMDGMNAEDDYSNFQ